MTDEMEEIAESRDEVRPRARSSGRPVKSRAIVEAAVGGDRGGDPEVYCEDGNGDETFRSWLYNIPFGDATLIVP